MRLSRWGCGIAVMVALGCLQVAQRTAIVSRGYAVGERMHRVHTQEADLSWLQTQVARLSSPAHLSAVAQERRLQLVAWSTLKTPRPSPLVQIASARPEISD